MSAEAILKYRKEITEFGSLDGTINFDGNIRLDPNAATYARVMSATLTKQIPNIYAYGGFNNTKLQVTNDEWQNVHEINLPNGNYTLYELQLAVNETIRDSAWGSGWFTSFNDPGILIEANTATGRVVTVLDNTKTTAGTGRLGIWYEGSTTTTGTLYETLGYIPASTSKITNSTGGRIAVQAPAPPKLDTQGTQVDIVTSLNPEFSYVNERNTNVLLSIPLTVEETNADEYVYPIAGFISPFIRIKNSGNVTGWNVKYQTQTGRQMVFLYGTASLTVQLTHGTSMQ